MNMPHSLELPTDWYVRHFEVTDSTMLRLRDSELSERPEAFVLVTADYQTAGRGQKGTSWEADPKSNLLFGFLFHPEKIPATQQFSLSEALALAVADSLSAYTDGISIKWPNDIYWQDRKICGMLLEHDLCGSHIATTLTGVGLNINQKTFRSNAPNPVSLLQITNKETDRSQILQQILSRFVTHYLNLQNGHYEELHRQYMQKLYRRNGWYTYRDPSGVFRAEIVEISPLGVLTLRKEDGTLQPYAFKEISYII